MQIVIDIPDDTCRWIKKNHFVPSVFIEEVCEAIKDGISLPKRHGRLIDADKVQERINELLKEPEYQHEGEDWETGLIMAEELIVEALTIIEADTAESEDKE